MGRKHNLLGMVFSKEVERAAGVGEQAGQAGEEGEGKTSEARALESEQAPASQPAALKGRAGGKLKLLLLRSGASRVPGLTVRSRSRNDTGGGQKCGTWARFQE